MQVGFKTSLRYLAVAFLAAASIFPALAQSTISTGSVQGTVTDPSGALVSAAKVSIRNKGTNQTTELTTNSSGAYTSGALIPGEYVIRVEASGFQTVQMPVTVLVNTTSNGNVKLSVGQSSQVVEVQASEIAVNTDQATVQGIINAQQIENLPINGRNFLDITQLEPGVQLQDGGTFDPTKNGFSSISFGGRFGRTARIEVDGVDISDETVGTTTQNFPLGAIQEASVQQSSLDLSTELTSSGSLNVSTRSGTNSLHGEGFYYFRDQSLNAALPGASTNPFQRNQFGGDVGGAIIRNKLFFFIDAERTKQDLLDPVIPGGKFAGLTGSFNSPFRETQALGRMDYQTSRFKTFYRFTFDQNRSVAPFIPNSFQPFANVNHARDHVVGVDFNTGNFTHSIRLGYTKFQNGITDAVLGSSIFNPGGAIELAIGGDPNCLTAGLDDFCSGPNFLAPQATVQSNRQAKYDGSKAFKNHIFRFGVGFNHLQGGGFAEFLGLAPEANSPSNIPIVGTLPGGDANPLNYPALNVTLGNGQGFSSEKKSFGFPAGGLGPDNRFSFYVGDSWKVKPNLTVTLGLRYVHDTGRTDSDVAAIPALEQFGKGLGNRVNQPSMDFAPQLGLTWDPSGSGKTVFRAGIGLFYENSIWNNLLFDRPARLQQGLFLAQTSVCDNGLAQPLPFTTSIDPNAICGAPIGSVASQITQLQQQYQAAVLAAGPQSNDVYVGNLLADGIDVTGTNLLAPNYKTPRSVQMNFGLQHEIHHGVVLTIDYLRNVATHNLLSIDTNHIGDARYLDSAAALAAINATLAANAPGCAPATSAGASSQSAVNCYLAAVPTASITDFASQGLDSGYSFCGGLACSLLNKPAAAFPGINPALGTNQMLFPIGRSVYNGLQTSVRGNVNTDWHGVKALDFQVSYAFSRYVSTARDNDFINFPTDNANPLHYIGPNGLDRTHQLSFGGSMQMPHSFSLGLTSHFDSPLPSTVTLPVSGNAGGIFQTDWTGDGTGDGSIGSNGGAGDVLPGTNVGGFGRSFGVSGLNKLITNYNSNFAGKLTPAGAALVSANLVTASQLSSLQAVMPTVPLAPAGAVGQAWLRTFDLSLAWAYKVRERVELKPSVTFFNLFNFSNFDGPAVPFSTILDGSPGSPNGTTNPQPNDLRLGLGTGVNSLGSPRAIEFTLKLSF